MTLLLYFFLVLGTLFSIVNISCNLSTPTPKSIRTTEHLAHASLSDSITGFTNRDLDDEEADIDTIDNDGNTLLHEAAIANNMNAIKILIDNKKSNINKKNNKGNTPLHEASIADHINVIKILLKRGANVNTSNKDGNTPLHETTRFDHSTAIEILLKHGANVNACNKDGNTPLHMAVIAGNINIIAILLKHRVTSMHAIKMAIRHCIWQL